MISKLQYITQGETAQDHLDHIQTACASGAEWVQLRLKGFDPKTILETAKKARELTAHYQTRLIINDYYKVAKEVNADGVHLGKKDDCPLKVRAYLGKFYSIGGTANTLEECKVLLEKKVDYIGLGPFRFTETKKNLSPVLGVDGYKKIIEELKTQTPIIAIGGITLDDVAPIVQAGIYGVAASGAITRDFTSIPVFHKILSSPSTQEQVYKMDDK
ncbi:thiamine phosphate synthase [Tenacibaculum finnmarkense]|uniref:thiamine phosphate synthase n=1 Tax=Tenacibaculum finnmarkense TaxID=2781243 RepID=UPI001E369B95|nr:thiamine phosphate synthase [Tenacibaculum finnmarkense]MCD8412464.1 thiamine phosphate synthase [Tenacibaculum finnmarkense genomovar ulcerans]MCG8206819.1 thiamine phosphate synthase [Tenacibaculum finnmarkense genomovar finnmarkense]MCG8723005.1 thiamine phosphate synthase [Tenacibaculum finnmarkense]MCG8741271.1 thiamine phosphate synthase [Tenacibaculum finnmarkense]MCG8764550.1 thiamine phosphate synthase [Tenacibaculum finnmarkense]